MKPNATSYWCAWSDFSEGVKAAREEADRRLAALDGYTGQRAEVERQQIEAERAGTYFNLRAIASRRFQEAVNRMLESSQEAERRARTVAPSPDAVSMLALLAQREHLASDEIELAYQVCAPSYLAVRSLKEIAERVGAKMPEEGAHTPAVAARKLAEAARGLLEYDGRPASAYIDEAVNEKILAGMSIAGSGLGTKVHAANLVGCTPERLFSELLPDGLRQRVDDLG